MARAMSESNACVCACDVCGFHGIAISAGTDASSVHLEQAARPQQHLARQQQQQHVGAAEGLETRRVAGVVNALGVEEDGAAERREERALAHGGA